MPGKIFLSTPGGGTSYPYTPADVAGSTGPLTVLGGTLTGASTPFLNLSQTWNNAATTFTGALVNVTDTASSSASLLQDWQNGGVSKASISKAGLFTCSGLTFVGSNPGVTVSGTFLFNSDFSLGARAGGLFVVKDVGAYTWSSSTAYNVTPDTYLYRDAAYTIAQRNGVNAQAFRVYNTYTDASNYERGVFDWTTTANTLSIGTVSSGTGSARNTRIFAGNDVQLAPSGSKYVSVQGASGHILPSSDATQNIGSASARFNKIYPACINTDSAVNVTSTLAAGWSMLSFTDNSNAQKFFFGYGNGSAASLAGISYLQTAGVDFAIYNNTTENFRFKYGGGVTVPATITVGGTTGAQTINKMAGSVNFAAAATSLVVTDSLVTTSSLIFPSLGTADATAVLGAVIPASGSFTINMKVAPTAETRVNFVVLN